MVGQVKQLATHMREIEVLSLGICMRTNQLVRWYDISNRRRNLKVVAWAGLAD